MLQIKPKTFHQNVCQTLGRSSFFFFLVIFFLTETKKMWITFLSDFSNCICIFSLSEEMITLFTNDLSLQVKHIKCCIVVVVAAVVQM